MSQVPESFQFFRLEELCINCSLVASKLSPFLSRGKPQSKPLSHVLPQGIMGNVALKNPSPPQTLGKKTETEQGLVVFFLAQPLPLQ